MRPPLAEELVLLAHPHRRHTRSHCEDERELGQVFRELGEVVLGFEDEVARVQQSEEDTPACVEQQESAVDRLVELLEADVGVGDLKGGELREVACLEEALESHEIGEGSQRVDSRLEARHQIEEEL